MRITKRLLQSKGACVEQVELFAKLFPKGVMVTKALCVKHAQDFSWSWAATNLFTEQQRVEYFKIESSAMKKYEKIADLAWAQYKKIEDSAWADYEKIKDLVLSEYKTKCALAFYEASKQKKGR